MEVSQWSGSATKMKTMTTIGKKRKNGNGFHFSPCFVSFIIFFV